MDKKEVRKLFKKNKMYKDKDESHSEAYERIKKIKLVK